MSHSNSQVSPPLTSQHTPPLWTSPERAAAFQAWLAPLTIGHGLRPDTLRLASADASFRRYFRVDSAHGSRIIMDAPPALEDSAPFVKVAELMRQAGVRVPEVLAWDQAQGFLLLTDLGQHTLLQTIDREQPQANLSRYLQAIDALIAWQKASQPNMLPAYDVALLRRELALFPDWYISRHRGITIDGELDRALQSSFDQIVAQNLSWPSVYVHRDFMPRNLMVGETGLGVLDFQDAVYGPITYDIASLTRDAFLSWEEDFVLDVTVRYWDQARAAGLPVGTDFGEFYRGVEWMGLQRHLKVAGIFARLTLRDGKPQYLADAPRFITYIRSTASRYRELTPLLRLIDRIEGIEPVSAFAFGRM